MRNLISNLVRYYARAGFLMFAVFCICLFWASVLVWWLL